MNIFDIYLPDHAIVYMKGMYQGSTTTILDLQSLLRIPLHNGWYP